MADDVTRRQREFFENLQSVAKLVGDLASNIADAQDRLDTSYVRSLAAFLEAIRAATADLPDSEARAKLIQSLAPSRYQLTQTVVEVRADLQTTSATQLGLDASLGYRTPVLAAAVNASYVKRSAYDYRAAALIRTVLQAVPAEPAVMEKLIEAARNAGSAELPEGSRFGDLADALKDLPPLEPAELPPFLGEAGGDVEEQEPVDELRIEEVPPPVFDDEPPPVLPDDEG